MTIRILTEHERGLGLGHVARCYNLAHAFVSMGYNVDLFVRGNAPFMPFIEKQGKLANDNAKCYVLALQWENIENPALLASDICIIDSYMIDDFTPFLESTKILVLLDDFGRYLESLKQILQKRNAKNAEIFLLNPNGFYKTQDMAQNIKEHIISGLQYALLNPYFHDASLTNKAKSCDFLVCLGGEDSNDISSVMFNQLLEFAKSITIIVGASYKGSLLNSKYLCKDFLQDSKKPYIIYHNITQMQVANLLAQTKHCIVSGGGIVFEALKLCQSVFVVNLATNQDIQIEMLSKQNLVTQITLPLKQSYFNTKTNARQNELCKDIGSSISNLTTKLALLALNKNITIAKKKHANFSLDNYTAINFCNLSQSEIMRVLNYRNHPFVRENMYGSSIINAQTHHNFLQSLHNNETSRYFLVQDCIAMPTIESMQTHDIGVINLSRINLRHQHAYLGIYKNPFLAKTNQRYGQKLMQMIKHIAFKHYNLYMLYLEVIATNTNAIKFYEREGFSYLGVLNQAFKIKENTTHNANNKDIEKNQEANKSNINKDNKYSKETFCDIFIYGMQNPNIAT